MTSHRTLYSAKSRFEAARQLDSLGKNHKSHGMHGHGFIVSVQACMPAGSASYPGAEAHELQQQLKQKTAQLDYATLNNTITNPSDANIARWLYQQLLPLDIQRIQLQSTPTQGVELHKDGTVCHWRKYRFHAAHQLPNVPAGHKCGRMHGHGFQVMLHVAEDDSPSANNTSMYDTIDALWEPLASQLDYRCLNDIPGLENPTSEMLSSWIWAQLSPATPQLKWVTVYETASCGSVFDGIHYQIWKDTSIDSAIQYHEAPGSDPKVVLHGDTFTVRLNITAPLDQLMGWTVDFGDVKTIFDPVFKALDHRPLYQYPEFKRGDTASICQYILRELKADLPQLSGVYVAGSEGAGSLVESGPLNPVLPD